jgi:hypothetical protein
VSVDVPVWIKDLQLKADADHTREVSTSGAFFPFPAAGDRVLMIEV